VSHAGDNTCSEVKYCFWVTVALFLFFGSSWFAYLSSPLRAALVFFWLFAIILWCAFEVVEEADRLAELQMLYCSCEWSSISCTALAFSYQKVTWMGTLLKVSHCAKCRSHRGQIFMGGG
jgi:hypothetical protein